MKIISHNKRILIQFIKYGLVGLVGTFLHTFVMIFSVEVFHINPYLASTIGFILSLLVSFVLNSFWTFQSKLNGKPFVKYIVISIAGQGLNLMIILLFVDVLSLSYIIGQVVAIVVVPIINFVLNKAWAFKS